MSIAFSQTNKLNLALLGLGLTAVAAFACYFFFGGPSKVKAVEAPKSTKSPAPAKSVNNQVEVEDADDDEEEEEEEEAEEKKDESNDAAQAAADEAAALKEQYEAALRQSTRLIQGQAHARAMEKLTEAINLAPKIPSASKDILTLYNNRSAMYEKVQDYDACLRDISVVLNMDPNHLKARVRRARVYEAQVRQIIHLFTTLN